ncbi:XRE family transcriptional regulator [Rhizobium sp. Leaf384]|uniref:helix-turn-helix domain-containing protein n=1 Tax=unclassified Rhizobium TaxID=2613769 RepID=UPI000715A73A|nr:MULTISPECIES: helix-turn-helix transcriptional regulator [unclassified Rhizobium]KQS78848.1 XRE family transcriptional regulator [Rhizobium sp. Leaf384]KQS85517.1 XRE family transcriptional regulator [Rhizobium sp. Leaf383]
MADKQGVYVGVRLRRLRRNLGLTQAEMAADLEVSASYVALMERNHRPVTAEVLLRLARAYTFDLADLAGDGGAEHAARLQSVMKDPIFADIDLSATETSEVATGFPGFSEALLRLYTAYREAQIALAERLPGQGAQRSEAVDPVAATRRFLAARRNSFPTLDTVAEKLSATVTERGGLAPYLLERHGLRIRRLPSAIMSDALRRHDLHRKQILLDESLDMASQHFQLAQQLAYLEFGTEIADAVAEGHFQTETSANLARRSLASYGAAALLMPYSAFAKAVEARRYDLAALSRQFVTSFEQTAHRLTTLQKPGQERVPFFFIRLDAAGNVSKRLDAARFPVSASGGGCPLWTVHQVFRRPGEIVTQWLEFPDGQRFFSIARTVSAGGGAHGVTRVDRAVALVCDAQHADRLVYVRPDSDRTPTLVGITCRLCQRATCTARAEPPIGRQILIDDFRRTAAPFGFTDT